MAGHVNHHEDVFIGVDAGGTHTRAAILTAARAVLGRGHAGAANYRSAPVSQASEAIRTAIGRALREARPAPRRVRAVFIGCSGLEGPGDPEQAQRLLGGLIQADHHYLDTDVYAGHRGALGGEPGIFVVAGTGSIALGVAPDGRRARTGGWGNRFGDEGSANWIATQGIREALCSADGRGSATAILEELLGFVGLAQTGVERRLEEYGPTLTAWLYARERSIGDIAAFAPVVHRLANAGDAHAAALLDAAGASLAELVLPIRQALGLVSELTISCSGGVWQHNPTVRRSFHRRLQAAGIDYAFREAAEPAEIGAALSAMDSLGVRPADPYRQGGDDAPRSRDRSVQPAREG